ncbi:MAG TPA: hypothetical protein VFR15_12505, partial [Chloroflexia bacterium]|nr:hypothetical protein [Chloroflexia bacterium]
MPIPTNVFRNILRLEEHKGFTDSAVQGGLAAFARRWAEQLTEKEREAGPVAHAISALLQDYGTADFQARGAAVARVVDMLARYEKGEREAPPDLAPARAPKRAAPVSNGFVPSAVSDFAGYEDVDPRAKAAISSGRSGIAPATAPPPPVPVSPRLARRNAGLDSPVTVLKGVQGATARLLARLGVYTVRDALLFFPFRYDDFSAMKPIAELEPEVNQTVVATIWEVEARKTRTGRPLVTAVLADDSGTISVSWFNQEYLLKSLHQGDPIVIS